MPIPIGILSYLLLVTALGVGIALAWNSVLIPLPH